MQSNYVLYLEINNFNGFHMVPKESIVNGVLRFLLNGEELAYKFTLADKIIALTCNVIDCNKLERLN